jgi:hypothetical protein
MKDLTDFFCSGKKICCQGRYILPLSLSLVFAAFMFLAANHRQVSGSSLDVIAFLTTPSPFLLLVPLLLVHPPLLQLPYTVIEEESFSLSPDGSGPVNEVLKFMPSC